MLNQFKYQIKTKFLKKKQKKKHSSQIITQQLIYRRLGINCNYTKRFPVLKSKHFFKIERRLNVLNIPLKKTKRQITQKNIERLITVKTLKGVRHRYKLPVRGQRNKTNAKTQRKISQSYNFKQK